MFSEMEMEHLDENITINNLKKYNLDSLRQIFQLDFINEENYKKAFSLKNIDAERMEFIGDSYFEYFFITSAGKALLNSNNKNHNPTFL